MTPPRLVLVHGTRVSHTQWDLPAYRETFGGLDVAAPDLPGHGRRAGERFTTAAAVAAIEEAVESGDRALPVVLAGHSLGGYMAMAYAARHGVTVRPSPLANRNIHGGSSIGRARVSKTRGWGFDSLPPC